MELLLNSKIIESDKKEKIKNAIILLHGYGGDGADISSVAYSCCLLYTSDAADE